MTHINCEWVKQANKLVKYRETLIFQIEKISNEAKDNFLISVHLSQALHIDDLPKDLILTYLKTTLGKTEQELKDIGCSLE